ncbi:hypothetical protein NPIL_256171 [Nephila pilipes]|uniref:Uncharacterized protein n=1 Tax=Nephila pilipes TaxID=299642 RepID=A0A8X6QKH9_NEPPI|nr:hypothetical protein NPIL_256171 [Nephila pilipes]
MSSRTRSRSRPGSGLFSHHGGSARVKEETEYLPVVDAAAAATHCCSTRRAGALLPSWADEAEKVALKNSIPLEQISNNLDSLRYPIVTVVKILSTFSQ